MYINHNYLLDEHRRKIDRMNREGWKFSKGTKRYKLNNKKDFCFTLGKDWCITVRYS